MMEERKENDFKMDTEDLRLLNAFGEALGDLPSEEETRAAWNAFTSRLSRYYNVSITCTPEVAQKCTMGKLILFDDIEQVMKTFSLLYDVQCTIEAGSIKIE